MTYNFFAILSRMKYIERWALMRNARTETLSEHTLDVAMIAHALCVIGNVRFGRALDADRADFLSFDRVRRVYRLLGGVVGTAYQDGKRLME